MDRNSIKIGDIVRVVEIDNSGFDSYEVVDIEIDLNCLYGYRFPIWIRLDNGDYYWIDAKGVDIGEKIRIEKYDHR